MARITRSQYAGKSKKFLDEDIVDAEIIAVSSREPTLEPETLNDEDQEDSDSDSDSDAPEEESTSVAKDQMMDKLKKDQQRQQELRQQERKKRKQRDAQLREQLEARRERIRELAAAEELPDLLPEEVLAPEPETQGKHIRLEELEREHAESRKRAKLDKLRQIKELRKQALKKGPVHVQVQAFGLSKQTVPRAEASVLETKHSWLQRASLGKK